MSAFHYSFTNRIRTVSNYKRKLPLSPLPGSELGQPWGNHGSLLSLARDLGWGEGKALKKDFSLSLKKILKKDHRSKSSYSVFFFKKSNPCLWNPPPPSIFLVDIHFHDLSSCQSWKFTHSFPIELICFYIHGIAQKKKNKERWGRETSKSS